MSLLGRVRRFFTGGSKPRLAGDSPLPIRAKYDNAQTTDNNAYHWASADSYDADSANSKAVRSTLAKRSRYETENNGDAKGINLTHANYVVGRGPVLRMESGNKGFNDAVEAVWKRWAKLVKLARKLRTMVKARVRDGEAFLFITSNPTLPEKVRLDVVGIECEQITTPYLPYRESNRIDGIKFDEWGNPLWYDMLKYHPGGQWAQLLVDPERVPAKFMLHLFREDRPGQHRAVPEITSTLGNFAQNRRFREAVISAAENIANFSVLVKTGASLDEGPDQLTTFSTLPVQKGMMVALPGGGDAFQPKAEQPSATYSEFTRSQLREEARPLNMPYNIAACDSSDYSFSGGRLDHLTYFVSVDVDQADIEDTVLDPLFEIWFAEAVLEYGWNDTGSTPAHSWAWPPRPQIDDEKTARARQTNLATGTETPSNIANENGYDYEDHVQRLASDYGVGVEEIKQALFRVNVLSKAGSFAQPQPTEKTEDSPPGKANGVNRIKRLAKPNGNGRA